MIANYNITEEQKQWLWTLPRNEGGFKALCEYVDKSKQEVEAKYIQAAQKALFDDAAKSTALVLKGHVDSLTNVYNFLLTLKATL